MQLPSQAFYRLSRAGLALTVLALACMCSAQGADLRQAVGSYRAAHERQILQQLRALVQLRSVAADPAGLATAARSLVDAFASGVSRRRR
jgi:histidine ammonia-lyase